MVYGYIRVSTDKQTVENQRFEIESFCQREGILIDKWIEETISGTKNYTKRQLGIQSNTVLPLTAFVSSSNFCITSSIFNPFSVCKFLLSLLLQALGRGYETSYSCVSLFRLGLAYIFCDFPLLS